MPVRLHLEPAALLIRVDLVFHRLLCMNVPLDLMVKTNFPQVTFGFNTKVLSLHFKHLHLPLNLNFLHLLFLVLLPQVIGLFAHVNLFHTGHCDVLIPKVHRLLLLKVSFHLVLAHLVL